MNAENIRKVIKALENVNTVSGSKPICFAVSDYLVNIISQGDHGEALDMLKCFDDTKHSAWKEWEHYSNSGSLPIPITKGEFSCPAEQFFADLETRQLWSGDAGKMRRSLLKHMLAFYRLELARLLPPGFEAFKAFVMAQDSKKVIDNDGWHTCAVGGFARFKGVTAGPESAYVMPLTTFAHDLTKGKPKLFHKLAFSKFATYGDLKRYLQKTYK